MTTGVEAAIRAAVQSEPYYIVINVVGTRGGNITVCHDTTEVIQRVKNCFKMNSEDKDYCFIKVFDRMGNSYSVDPNKNSMSLKNYDA